MKTRRKRSGGILHQSSDLLHDVCNLVHLRFGKSVHCGANSIKRIRFRGLCVCADIDQLAERNFKSVCDFSQRFNGRTFFPAFNFSDISGMDFGGKCQLLLAEVLFGAELTDSFSHDDGEIGSVFHDDYLSFCAESLLWILGNTNCQDTKGMILFILSVFFCRIKSI